MSKKNYMLSCAFFLLAGNLRDAVKVAIDKLRDPVLAVLMARLFEKENFNSYEQQEKKEETMQEKLYLEEFVQRGQRLEDPYLQNIGYWQRKEYIKALNAFHVEPSQINMLTGIFNQATNLPEQNLYYSAQPTVILDKQKHLLEQAAA